MLVRRLVAVTVIAALIGSACITPDDAGPPPDPPPTPIEPGPEHSSLIVEAPGLTEAFLRAYPDAVTVPALLRVDTTSTGDQTAQHTEMTITALDASGVSAPELPAAVIVIDSGAPGATTPDVQVEANPTYEALRAEIDDDLAAATGARPTRSEQRNVLPCVAAAIAVGAAHAALSSSAATVQGAELGKCLASEGADVTACTRASAAGHVQVMTATSVYYFGLYTAAIMAVFAAAQIIGVGNWLNPNGANAWLAVAPIPVAIGGQFVGLIALRRTWESVVLPIATEGGYAANGGTPRYPALNKAIAAYLVAVNMYTRCTLLAIVPLVANAGVGVGVAGRNPANPPAGNPPGGGGGGMGGGGAGGGGAGGGGAGGGGGGGGNPPPPGARVADGGPSLPGLGSDDTRYFLSPLYTALPDDAAVAQTIDVDLEAPVSPLNGAPMANQLAYFNAQSQTEPWGTSFCTGLRADINPGGPYEVYDLAYGTNSYRLQEAHMPFWVNSGLCGRADSPDGCIAIDGTTFPVPTLTMRRVCDGDDNNDAIPDNLQGGNYCYDEDGDGLEDLWSISLDSEMPNRFVGHTTNCGGGSLDLALHYQDGQQPGMTAPQLMAAKDGAEVSQTYQIYTMLDPYRDIESGAAIGTGTMVRVRLHGTLHAPEGDCWSYQYVYDPYGSASWKWVWDYSQPGCMLF